MPGFVQSGFLKLVKPLISLFTRTRVNPNWFTTLGLILNIVAALSFAWGAKYGTREDLQYIGWGGFFVLIGGLCDMLDGKVARAAGLSTRFGALYDSVLDRYSEVIMFLGMGYYLVAKDYFYESVFCFIALGGSTMVSYIRARSEALHIECKVGIMQRPERIVWLGAGSMFCGLSTLFVDPSYVLDFNGIHLFKPIYIFTVPLVIVAVLANTTSIQRMIHSYRESAVKEEASQIPQSSQTVS
ncbi:MAG: CDP-alcohol phosphatidyltransferase family protein [Bacteroidetes bacterium]|nr:CDP-alcohol phosphatidyltransferase family protein [Bacteroidota bacterium]